MIISLHLSIVWWRWPHTYLTTYPYPLPHTSTKPWLNPPLWTHQKTTKHLMWKHLMWKPLSHQIVKLNVLAAPHWSILSKAFQNKPTLSDTSPPDRIDSLEQQIDFTHQINRAMAAEMDSMRGALNTLLRRSESRSQQSTRPPSRPHRTREPTMNSPLYPRLPAITPTRARRRPASEPDTNRNGRRDDGTAVSGWLASTCNSELFVNFLENHVKHHSLMLKSQLHKWFSKSE